MSVRTAELHLEYRTTLRAAVVLLVLLFASYAALVNQTVRSVVERRNLEADNSLIGSQVSELEFAYMGQKNAITPERAAGAGFSEARHITYVPRSAPAPALSLNR